MRSTKNGNDYLSFATRNRIYYNMDMAPFNTHFLVAEKIWPTVQAMVTWPATCSHIHYGQFCFGCVAPDIDKLSATLSQKDTHFFARSESRKLVIGRRSYEFLRQQNHFLAQPFARLPADAQAFALGYLCHLAVDEVSKHLWGYNTWIKFKDIGPGPAFAALDEVARQQMTGYPALVDALSGVQILPVIPTLPPAELEAYFQGVRNFAQAPTVEDEFLTLVDLFLQPTPIQRDKLRQEFCTNIQIARQRVGIFNLNRLLRAGVKHSQRRFTALIEGHLPEPGFPKLD